MIRNVLSVIIGYAAMAAVVFVAFTIAYMTLGADGAFKPDVFEVSTTWLTMAVIVNLIAAIVGGLVCKVIARQALTTAIFALIVFILGLLVAIPIVSAEDAEPTPREGDVAMLDAMKDAEQPIWFALTNPLVAAAGILIGGTLIPGRAARMHQ